MTDLWETLMAGLPCLGWKGTTEASRPRPHSYPRNLPWLAWGQNQVWTGRGAGQAG